MGRDGKYFFPRRDGTANIFSLGGTGRQYFFPRRGGTTNIFSTAERGGNFLFVRRCGTVNIFSSAERDGKYIFLLSCRKVGAVVREDFPALLWLRERSRPDADVYLLDPRLKLREVLPLHGRRFLLVYSHPCQALTVVAVPAHGGCSDG